MGFWQRRKLRKQRAKCMFTGIAIIRRDGISQKNYWETTNANGEDMQSVTGGGPIDLDPSHLPIGTRVELYLPKER